MFSLQWFNNREKDTIITRFEAGRGEIRHKYYDTLMRTTDQLAERIAKDLTREWLKKNKLKVLKKIKTKEIADMVLVKILDNLSSEKKGAF